MLKPKPLLNLSACHGKCEAVYFSIKKKQTNTINVKNEKKSNIIYKEFEWQQATLSSHAKLLKCNFSMDLCGDISMKFVN